MLCTRGRKAVPNAVRRTPRPSRSKSRAPSSSSSLRICCESEAETYHINPFDLTKIWPHKDYPLVEAGELVLDRNPENYFADVEQAAFEPRNVVPGMGYSPDKMLQACLISYPDAHRYRLGVNYDVVPVNKPQCPYHTYSRDGAMRFDGDHGAAPTAITTRSPATCFV
jgi:catalase